MPVEETDEEKHLRDKRRTVEGEIFGYWTIILRNVGGFLATFTTCGVAMFNAFTTHSSVVNGTGWPSDVTMFLLNAGPIIIAWTFFRSGKLIESIVGGSKGKAIRSSLAKIISPEDESNRGRRADN